mmetsp:Transcript_109622/g.341644  ORF Transcript_109622/g.341644 Transcript_109622/m.341644 type:complete len:200 (-) Transcript_109622:6-605(-)
MDCGPEELPGRAAEGEPPPREERRFGRRRRDGLRGGRCLHGLPPFEESTHSLEMFRRPNRPICPRCKSPARPNVLMFSDLGWIDNAAQERRWNSWLQALKEECQQRRHTVPVNVVIMEIGAGTGTMPAVRSMSQTVAGRLEQVGANVTLVRVNPSKSGPDGIKGARLKHFIGLPLKGLEALEEINGSVEALLAKRRSRR